jgi:hypothetical protein
VSLALKCGEGWVHRLLRAPDLTQHDAPHLKQGLPQHLHLFQGDSHLLRQPWHQQYLDKNPAGYCGIGGTGVSVVFVRITGNPDDRTRAQIEAAPHIFSMYTVR